MRFGRQYSVKNLLLLMLVAAISIWAYQRFIYVHPAHRTNTLYEKSPPITGRGIQVGPCRLVIKSVARTDRDGTLLFEDGFGKNLETTVANANVLKSSGPWLDTTQIEFAIEGGEVDIYDFRIFDHETRLMIDKSNSARGQRPTNAHTLQIYGLGNKVPDRVDVFMRLRGYGPANKPLKLAPAVNASITTPHGDVVIERIIRGMRGYNQIEGFVTSPERQKEDTALLLRYDGKRWTRDAKYEITAITKRGERLRSDFHIRFPGDYVIDGERFSLSRWSWDVNEIEYFEVRPLGEYHRFFFDGLRLPQTSNAKFLPPPNPALQFNGQEQHLKVTELEPLDVSFQILRGDAVSGTHSTNGNIAFSFRKDGPKNPEQETTILGRVHGLSSNDWNLTLVPTLGGWSNSAQYGGGRWISVSTYRAPIEDIQQLKIQLPMPMLVPTPP